MTPHPQPKEFYQIDRMVNAFSRIMKMKLHENMHKGSWEKCTFDYLRSRIDDEIKEFDKAIEEGRYSDAMIEGGDVGNFFAMIGDNIEFGRFKNYTHSRPAPSPDEMEERFISKRQAWEQGYQDGQSSVQHDLHLLRHEAIHSRPAPSSAHVVITETKNKITCDHCGKIVEYLNSWTYRNDDGIKRYLCSERCYDLESDKQHDATIRQQERERVLDKVISFCKSNDCVQATYGDQDCMSTTDSECVICFCESLRSREGGDE